MISFTCTFCEYSKLLKMEWAEKRVKCPKCGLVVQLPTTVHHPTQPIPVQRPTQSQPPIPNPQATQDEDLFDFYSSPETPTEPLSDQPSRSLKWLGISGIVALGMVALIAVGLSVRYFSARVAKEKGEDPDEQVKFEIADFVGRWRDDGVSGFDFNEQGEGTRYFLIPDYGKHHYGRMVAFWTGEVRIEQNGQNFFVKLKRDSFNNIEPKDLFLNLNPKKNRMEVKEEITGVFRTTRETTGEKVPPS